MPNIYGPYLKDARVKKGIKAAYVARRIGVSPPTYSQIESGERGLPAERLEGILKAMSMVKEDLDSMMYGTRVSSRGGRESMECKKCSSPLAEGASFCAKCGKKAPPPPKVKKIIDLNSKLGFSVAETAVAIGVSAWFIYEEIKQRNIGYTQLHGRKIIPRWALEEYLKKHEVPAREVAT